MSPKLVTTEAWFNVENGKITEWGINEPSSPSTPPLPKPTSSGQSSSSATAHIAEAESPPTVAGTAPSDSSKPPATPNSSGIIWSYSEGLPPNNSVLPAMTWGDCSSNPVQDIKKWKEAILGQPVHMGLPPMKSNHLSPKVRNLEANEDYIQLVDEPKPGVRVLLDEDAIQARNPKEVDLLYRAIPEAIRQQIVCDYASAGCHRPKKHHVVTMYNDRMCEDPEKWFRDALELTL